MQNGSGHSGTIHRVRIENYAGITFHEETLARAGAIVAGGNAKGKTSFLKAILAALAAKGIDASAVRKGAEKAVITVDLDHATVKRIIPATGRSTVTVASAEATYKKPAEFLAKLFDAGLDPLAFFLAKPPERRAALLEAMPLSVTPDDLIRWVPGLTVGGIAQFLQMPVESGKSIPQHALVVVESLRESLYSQRTAANKAEKEAEGAVSGHRASFVAALAEIPGGRDRGQIPAMPVAQTALANAREAVMALLRRADDSARAESRATATRVRVSEKRAQAERLRERAPALPTEEEVAEADAAIRGADGEIASEQRLLADLEEQIRQASRRLGDAARARQDAIAARNLLGGRATGHAAALERAAALDAGAAELESTIDIPPAPLAEETFAAQNAVEAADRELAAARAAEEVRRHEVAVAAAEETHRKAAVLADALDKAVKALTHDAPAELLGRANGIKGVALAGSEITLDGVSLDRLSGAEQMLFSIEIARRASSSGVLIVDGIERLDPEQMTVFVEAATRDGFQLLATQVTSGALQVLPLAPNAADMAAE